MLKRERAGCAVFRVNLNFVITRGRAGERESRALKRRNEWSGSRKQLQSRVPRKDTKRFWPQPTSYPSSLKYSREFFARRRALL